jgi:hypothetical protein
MEREMLQKCYKNKLNLPAKRQEFGYTGIVKFYESLRTNLLTKICKTNPMVCYSNPILSPKTDFSAILQNLFMQNEPNGML